MRFLGSSRTAARVVATSATVAALLWTLRSEAGPITGVRGPIEAGQPIVVEGSGFGSQGPDILLYDDFDCPTCASGDPLALDATIGAWSSTTNVPTYTDDQSHAGLSMLASNYLPNSGGCPGASCDSSSNYSRASIELSPPASEAFISFWRYLPPDQVFPLESCDNINWKVAWLYGTEAAPDNVINDWILPVYNAQNHADGFEEPSFGSNQGFTEENCGQDMYPMYYVEPAATGTWIRYSFHVKGSTSCDGSFRAWQIPFIASETAGYACGDDHNTCEMLRKERLGIDTMIEPWHYFTLNAYARNAENGCEPTDVSVPRYDDAYVAVGPGAQARVEIASQLTWGDAAFADSLNMAVCPPTAWSDASVTCTLAQGSFADGASVFLFVVDADGVVSDQDPDMPGAQGFPITLGDSSSSGGGGSTPGTGGEGEGAASSAGGAAAAGGASASAGGGSADSGESGSCECTSAATPTSPGWLAGLALAVAVRRRYESLRKRNGPA